MDAYADLRSLKVAMISESKDEADFDAKEMQDRFFDQFQWNRVACNK